MITQNYPLFKAILNGNKLPQNATETDSGFDVCSISEPNIVGIKGSFPNSWKSVDYIEYDLGIAVEPVIKNDFDTVLGQETRGTNVFYLQAFARSSVSKYNLVLANSVGIIDNGYRNTIKARFKYIFQPEDLFVVGVEVFGRVNLDKIYQKGDKCVQLIAAEKIKSKWVEVNHFNIESERGLGGFGSTGA